MIVASFFAPRFDMWEGVNYDALLPLLDASCRRLDLRHVTISDGSRPGVETFICSLPENLMAATLDGQRQFLEQAREPVLLVGADCLLTRDPRPFGVGCDMAITIGPFSDCEMNTGAVWCMDGPKCAPIWQAALDRNPIEWGQDQTTLYAAVRNSHDILMRRLRCEDHNWAPESPNDDAGMPTVVHFRGRRKAWMAGWSERFLP